MPAIAYRTANFYRTATLLLFRNTLSEPRPEGSVFSD
jgi:hypothetical protein